MRLTFWRRLHSLWRRDGLDRELREEIDAHIELRQQALVDEGMDPRDAAFEARRMFGNVTRVREQSREIWSFPVMQSVLQDIRYGARLLRRAPFFTLVAVASIAFGLGGGLIIFTIANAGIFRPLAGAGADLHRIYTANHGGTVYGGNSYADHRDFANAASIFAATCATARVRANVTMRGEAARHEGAIVIPRCFDVLRSGRDFAERDREGAPPVAIASETLARTLWNTTGVVGRTLTMDGKTVEIVGVVADTRYRAVSEPFRPVMYLSFDQYPQGRFFIHARTKGGGETLAALDRAARSVDPRIVVDRAMPLVAWLDEMRAPERATQWIGGAAGVAQFALVLMALWALVAYSVERRTAEIGVRLALGATPRSLVQLILRPALSFIAAGAVLGSAIGVAAGTVLESEFVGVAAVEPATGIPVILALAAVATVAAFIPARRVTRVDPITALRAE